MSEKKIKKLKPKLRTPENPVDIFKGASSNLNRAAENILFDGQFGNPLQHIDQFAESVSGTFKYLSEKLTGTTRERILDLIFDYKNKGNSIDVLRGFKHSFANDQSIVNERTFSGANDLILLARQIEEFQSGGELPPLSTEGQKKREKRLLRSFFAAFQQFQSNIWESWEAHQKNKNFELPPVFDVLNDALKEVTSDSVMGDKAKQIIQEYKQDPLFLLVDKFKKDPGSFTEEELDSLVNFFKALEKEIFKGVSW